MNRNVSEVTLMAYKLKNSVYRPPGEAEKLVENINKKLKTKKQDAVDVTSEAQKFWSQEQQKALEAAIQKIPKSVTDDRWQKIANCVPGKTKEECLLRYKYLVELVKKQKEDEERKKQEQEEIERKRIEELERKREEQEMKQKLAEESKNAAQQKGGKKKNKRKEAKKIIDYYEDSEEDASE